LRKNPDSAGPGLDFETRDPRGARRLLQTSYEPCQGTTFSRAVKIAARIPWLGRVVWPFFGTRPRPNPRLPPQNFQKPPKLPNVESLSRGDPKIQSNNIAFHATYILLPSISSPNFGLVSGTIGNNGPNSTVGSVGTDFGGARTRQIPVRLEF
jgi:hypothetical protein